MDLGEIIHSETEAAIRFECGPEGRIKKPAFIQFFLNHENLKVLRKNLRLQVFGAELKYGAKMDKARLIKIIKAGVDVFMHGALESAILAHLSPAERKRREDANGAEKRAAEWYEEEQKALASTSISGSLYTPKEGNADEDKNTLCAPEDGASRGPEATPQESHLLHDGVGPPLL